MLKTLYIKNFTLIKELELSFNKGLNIITGETGSGKSIMIDAIDLAFGARASKDQIKTGEKKAIIELQLELPQSFPLDILEENAIELENDNVLFLSREITDKNTRSRVNGVLVTQNYVQELRKHLIDIHSQHQTYTYIQPKTHIDLLDNYGNEEHKTLLNQYLSTYRELILKTKEYDFQKSQSQSVEQKIDFLKFQIEEIENAQIEHNDEYEDLLDERSKLVNAEELKDLTYSSYSGLYGQEGSIVDILGSLESKLIKASEYDKNLSNVVESISTSSINLKEAADELRNYADGLEVDQQRLSDVEERIDLIDKLRRKYGSTISEILNNLEKFKSELNEISYNSEQVEILAKQIIELEKEVVALAGKLSNSRKKLAKLLSELIQAELVKLEMPKVQFSVEVNPKEIRNSKGVDDVEFMISPNTGEPLKPLAKIASGGEISRVMLALKTVFAKADGVNTVIFDEIDAGISGKTSQSVAEELASLSSSHQIICITHQPIIAAMADEYFYVEKLQNDKETKVLITVIDEKAKEKAISKLASGNVDEDSLKFARKLIEQSNNYKNNIENIL